VNELVGFNIPTKKHIIVSLGHESFQSVFSQWYYKSKTPNTTSTTITSGFC